MKATSGLVMFVFLVLVSCFNPPEYSIIPEIEFNGVSFVDVPDDAKTSNGGAVADTLVLNLKFKDGDGDIGLLSDSQSDEIQFSDRFFFKVNDTRRYALRNGGSIVDIAKDPTFIKYKTKRTNPSYDTLPAFVDPYTCINWEIAKTLGTGTNPDVTIDTVYFQLNPNTYNIAIDFLQLKNDGSGDYEEYDFRKLSCGTPYDSRMPILAKDVGQQAPLQGTIRYAMAGQGFTLIFGLSRPLKLRIQITDRALNKSNVILTDPFTLSSITAK